ncbi:hypothetical protein ACLOJK_014383 [Asimina triloba]
MAIVGVISNLEKKLLPRGVEKCVVREAIERGLLTLLIVSATVEAPITKMVRALVAATLGEAIAMLIKGAALTSIWVCIMLGYLKYLEATRKYMRNEWFCTSNIDMMHPDGYLEIKHRSKDVIISSREHISRAEVESVLYMHSVIKEATVVARPDEF